jgi:hypothetical protein
VSAADVLRAVKKVVAEMTYEQVTGQQPRA